MASLCNICCEPHNKSTRRNVQCNFSDCNFEACKSCVRHYLLETAQDPHCMNCRKAWSQEFIVEKLNRSFVTSDYKTHRTKLLCEREISKLPESMAAAENVRKSELLMNEYHVMEAEVDKFVERLRVMRVAANQKFHEAQRVISGDKKQEAKREFVMPCQSDDCRGFLSTGYKCGLCSLFTCSKCLEVIGPSKDEPHECKEENLQSAEMIRNDTKPCPKCGIRIFKIDGCDQMWCSSCHTAWSWKSGRVDNGVVHNPHFYEFQRNNNGGVAPRVAGDVVCGGLIPHHQFRQHIGTKLTNEVMRNSLSNLHQTLAHIIHWNLTNFRNRGIESDEKKEDMRINYILGRITKEGMAAQIYRIDAVRRKESEEVQIFEILNEVGIETFATLQTSPLVNAEFEKLVADQLTQLDRLRVYCNGQFAKICKTYHRVVPKIEADWSFTRQRPHNLAAKT